MRLLIQRVKYACVEVDEKEVGKIDNGLLVFIGIHEEDSQDKIDYLVKKLIELRIFEDSNQKMNLSVTDIQGSVLVVSQFTLYADCKKGRRPDFTKAAKPDKAKDLYLLFTEKLKESGIHTETGIFATDMKVTLTNDGPVTIILEN